MVILDSDHLSIADQDSNEGVHLAGRLAAVPPGGIAVSIITYEEQMRGWLALAAKASTTSQQVSVYRKLRRYVERFRVIPLLDYDERAAEIYERLRAARIRIGTMDLRIAAIALASNATLLTRIRRDSERVPGLHFEGWSM